MIIPSLRLNQFTSKIHSVSEMKDRSDYQPDLIFESDCYLSNPFPPKWEGGLCAYGIRGREVIVCVLTRGRKQLPA